MVNRGYSSVTAMHDAYERLNDGDTILYFGDHDPSGLDMVRDIRERLYQFGLDVEVVPVALTSEQVKEFNPPPNPTKLQDPRAEWYVDKWGYTCWELDALPPKELIRLTEENIRQRIDLDKWQKIVNQEEIDKAIMREKFNLA